MMTQNCKKFRTMFTEVQRNGIKRIKLIFLRYLDVERLEADIPYVPGRRKDPFRLMQHQIHTMLSAYKP